MKDYVIRKADTHDKVDISTIYVTSWKFAYRGIVPQEYLDSLSTAKYKDQFKMGQTPGEFLFEVNGTVVGLAKLIDCSDRCADGCAEVQTIYFLPEFTGMGYGGIFLKWLREHAKDQGYEHMIIWVLNDNVRARKAYDKAGFIKDKARLVIIGGRELKESRYSLVL